MKIYRSLDLEFGHLPSIRRLPIGKEAKCKPETVMSESSVKQLFDGQRIIVEEKMNGTGVMFKADKGRFYILAEDLLIYKPGLTGRYSIPARYALFDIFDRKTKRFVSFIEKEDIFLKIKRNEISISEINSYNLFIVPLIAQGNYFKLDDIPQFLDFPSRYARDAVTGEPTYMEGVVVKPARALFLLEYEELVGKLIRNEYLFGESGISENYRRIRKQMRNRIDPSLFNDPNFLGRKTDPNNFKNDKTDPPKG